MPMLHRSQSLPSITGDQDGRLIPMYGEGGIEWG
jgi:hypothetical protein